VIGENGVMGEAIGQVFGFAVGVAISPVPIIAVILMLFSRKAATNSVTFLIGWLVGLTVVSIVVLAIGLESSDGGDDAGGVVKIVIGALFLLLAVRQWRSRPADGEEPPMPAWMASIDDFTPVRAFGLAVLLSAVNPKNLGLTIAAAATIGAVGLDAGEEAVVVTVYVVLASLTLIVPVVGYLAARQRMAPALESMKAWLMRNNATVMAVLFAVLGSKVLGDGISLVSS
jgi:threonine/homoserine/homoserine lactone efflux protein